MNAPEVKRERRCKEGISCCSAKPHWNVGKERGKQGTRLRTEVQTGKFRNCSGSCRGKGKEEVTGIKNLGRNNLWKEDILEHTMGQTHYGAGGCGNFVISASQEEWD